MARYEIQGYDDARGCYRVIEKNGIEDVYQFDGYPKGNVMHCYPRRPLQYGKTVPKRGKIMLGSDELKLVY